MFKSIRWRLSILYFVLVFIAMSIVGVLVSDRLEDYYLNQIEENLTLISDNTIMSIVPEGELREQRYEIQSNIEKIALPADFNVYLLDTEDFEIIAASNEGVVGRNAMDILNPEAIMKTMVEKTIEKDEKDLADGVSISKIYARFIPSQDGQDRYIIYSSASLKSAYQSLRAVTKIIINAASIALLITLIVGYTISGSITKPINDLNIKANLMAGGDFSQRVEITSDDEIGTLGTSFNYLTEKLDETLIEISSEKSKLDAIINNMADGLMAIDEKGFITLYNQSLLKLLDTKAMVLYGNNLTQLSREIGMNIRLEEIKKSLETSQDGNLVKKTKDQKTLRISTAFYKDDGQRLKGYALLFHDITESHKLEEMRREFVANVSHELKTPITTIKTYAETLGSGLVDDEKTQIEFAKTIEKEADRMTNLVKDLLDLSHIDFKKTKWDMEGIKVSELVRENVENLKIYQEDKEQTIKVLENADPVIFGDKNKISQVMVNIISNAIKYTAKGGIIEIEISQDKNYGYIAIKDDGIGIPQQETERIFERFYRVDKGRAREMGGTGLGLAIARDIVREHKGDIFAKSSLGEGSTFTIKLPLKKPENVKHF